MEGKLYDEIYQHLVSHFEPGEEIPADIVVKRMLAGGYVPQRYGYQNMREMFSDLNKILTVKNGADGKMTVVIQAQDDCEVQPFPRLRRGSGEIGLLSGKSFEEEKPVRKQTLPDNYSQRLPENQTVEPEKQQAAPYSFSVQKSTEIQEPDSLSEEIKKKIYTAVVMGLQLEKPLYMSTLSPVLRYAGVEHDKLGFLKSKNMLKRCSDFMDFEEVMMNGVPQTLVTVHHVLKWDEELGDIQRKSGSEQLDEEEKKHIYQVLCEHMNFGEAIHMAAFSPILKTYGFDYRNYGFQKVKELAAQLSEFLSLKEVMMNGVPQTLVTLQPYQEGRLPQEDQADDQNQEIHRPLHTVAFLPPKILGVLSRMTGNPVWACEEALEQSYIAAKKAGTLIEESKFISRKGVLSEDKEHTMRFPLNMQTMRGDMLVGELHETGSSEGKQWFLAWVGSPEFVRDGNEPSHIEKENLQKERILTPVLTDCCALSDSVVRAAAFKAIRCSEAESREMIIADYAAAYEQKKIIACGEEYCYTLQKQNLQGEAIYVLIAPNHIGDKPYYVRFVGSNVVTDERSKEHLETPVEEEKIEEIRIDNAPLPDELTELAYLPLPTISLLAHEFGMLQNPTMELIKESYQKCRESGNILRRPEEIRFPLLRKNLKGEEVYVFLRPSMGSDKDWFLQYFEGAFNPQEPTSSESSSSLEQFAFLGDWNGQIRTLAQIAAPEHWDFDDRGRLLNLKTYITGCFERIMQQDKLVYDSSQQMAVFHTGLYNRYGYDIYAQFAKNLPGSKLPWRFERFFCGKLDSNFVGMPVPPSYMDSRVSPWFELDRKILPIEPSVILKRISALPREFLRRNSNALEISLIEQMNLNPQMEKGCYQRLQECYEENPRQLEQMAEALGRAVNYALHCAKRDYAYVTMGYLPESNQVVWMLPITMQGSAGPDIVAAYILEYGVYRPVALLSRQEAYVAARFIRRMEQFWMQYEQVRE